MSLQKYFYVFIAILILQIAPVMAQNGEKNIVRNPGFESGTANWNIPSNTATTVDDASHGGKKSLHYVNTNSENYKRFTQQWKVQPGKKLLFSVWVKGHNVSAQKKSQGAGIYVQSYDAEGNYITGAFPHTLTGTFDWTLVKGEYTVPENAAKVSMGLYLRKSVTGEVWFDDVDVHYGKTQEFIPLLDFPNYRGIVKVGDATPWQMQILVRSQPEWKKGQIDLQTTLVDTKGKVLLRQSDKAAFDEKTINIILKKPQDLPVGNYALKLQATNPNGQMTLDQEIPIHVVESMPEVYIDGQGFTVVNGKRFFPLGIYTGNTGAPGDYRTNSQEIDLQRMADAGFNTVLSYSYARDADVNGNEFLDLAQKNNLHVIYSLKDMYNGHAGYPQNGISGMEAASRQIQNLKDHSALLAWYTNDEMKDSWLKEIQKRYDQIIDLKSSRPVYIVSNAPSYIDQFYSMSDILGTDPYPLGITGRSFDIVTNWTKNTATASRNIKGVWQVLQIYNPIFTGNKTRQDYQPTLAEMRNMSYQSLIHGSKGLLYYAYHWLFFDLDKNGKRIYSQEIFNKRWPDIKKMVNEIRPLTNVILEDNKINIKVLSPSTVQYQAWEYNGKLYIMMANAATQDKPASLQLQIPNGWHLANEVTGINTKIQGQTLQSELSPIASGIVILEK